MVAVHLPEFSAIPRCVGLALCVVTAAFAATHSPPAAVFCGQTSPISQPTAEWGAPASPPPVTTDVGSPPPTVATIAGTASIAGCDDGGGAGGPAAARFSLGADGSFAFVPLDGSLLIADPGCHCVWQLAQSGTRNHSLSVFAGIPGYRGSAGTPRDDGLPATRGRLYSPSSIVVDMAGDVLIGQGGTGVVRKVTYRSRLLSTVTTGFGSDVGALAVNSKNGLYGRDRGARYLPPGAAASSSLVDIVNGVIREIAVDADDVAYISHETAGLEKYDPTTERSEVFLSLSKGVKSSGLSFDGKGRLLYCHERTTLRMFDHIARKHVVIATKAQLGGACYAMAIARDGALLLSIDGTAIVVVRSSLIEPYPRDPPCVAALAITTTALAQPRSVISCGKMPLAAEPAAAWDAVKSSVPLRLSIFAGRNDTASVFMHGSPPTWARFNMPTGIAFDPECGDVIVADTANHVLRSVSRADRSVSYFAGEPGVPGSTDVTAAGGPPDGSLFHARFNNPVAVLFIAVGNGKDASPLLVIVEEPTSAKIRLVDRRNGTVATFDVAAAIGASSSSTTARMIAGDAHGRLIVVAGGFLHALYPTPYARGGAVAGKVGAASDTATGLVTAITVGRDGRAYVARGFEVLAFDIDRVAPGNEGTVVGRFVKDDTGAADVRVGHLALDGSGALLGTVASLAGRGAHPSRVSLQRLDLATTTVAAVVAVLDGATAGPFAVDRAGMVLYSRQDSRIGRLDAQAVHAFPRLAACEAATTTQSRSVTPTQPRVPTPSLSLSATPPPTATGTASTSAGGGEPQRPTRTSSTFVSAGSPPPSSPALAPTPPPPPSGVPQPVGITATRTLVVPTAQRLPTKQPAAASPPLRRIVAPSSLRTANAVTTAVVALSSGAALLAPTVAAQPARLLAAGALASCGGGLRDPTSLEHPFSVFRWPSFDPPDCAATPDCSVAAPIASAAAQTTMVLVLFAVPAFVVDMAYGTGVQETSTPDPLRGGGGVVTQWPKHLGVAAATNAAYFGPAIAGSSLGLVYRGWYIAVAGLMVWCVLFAALFTLALLTTRAGRAAAATGKSLVCGLRDGRRPVMAKGSSSEAAVGPAAVPSSGTTATTIHKPSSTVDDPDDDGNAGTDGVAPPPPPFLVRYYVVLDITLAVAFAAIAGLQPTSTPACRTAALGATAVAVAYAGYVSIVRPLKDGRSTVFLVASAWGQVVVCGVATASAWNDDAADPAAEESLQTAFAIVSLALCALLVLQPVMQVVRTVLGRGAQPQLGDRAATTRGGAPEAALSDAPELPLLVTPAAFQHMQVQQQQQRPHRLGFGGHEVDDGGAYPSFAVRHDAHHHLHRGGDLGRFRHPLRGGRTREDRAAAAAARGGGVGGPHGPTATGTSPPAELPLMRRAREAAAAKRLGGAATNPLPTLAWQQPPQGPPRNTAGR